MVNKAGLIGLLLAQLWLSSVSVAIAEEVVFVAADLDQMLESAASVGSAVQMQAPPQPVQFEAEVIHAVKERKTHYLLEVLAMMGVQPLPEVTQGLDVVSLRKRPLNLYVEKNTAELIGKELQAGDKVTLFGYHVYNSKKHGPGILVSGFEVPSRIDFWQGRLSRWLAGQ